MEFASTKKTKKKINKITCAFLFSEYHHHVGSLLAIESDNDGHLPAKPSSVIHITSELSEKNLRNPVESLVSSCRNGKAFPYVSDRKLSIVYV